MAEQKIAAIRIRGINSVKVKVEDTLKMLRLYRNNYCCVLPNTALYLGMLKRAKDYITWGELDEDTFTILFDKRAEEFKGREKDTKGKIDYNDSMIVNNKKIKKYFRLNPPKKGFGRKGTKQPFNKCGALGYRGPSINELIRRMI